MNISWAIVFFPTVNISQYDMKMVLFLDPNLDCIVECLKSCCNESSPPRYVCVRATTKIWHY
ncbi:hypothetical protein Hanom_Chr04g00304531 [Helianthus anomalus]